MDDGQVGTGSVVHLVPSIPNHLYHDYVYTETIVDQQTGIFSVKKNLKMEKKKFYVSYTI